MKDLDIIKAEVNDMQEKGNIQDLKEALEYIKEAIEYMEVYLD